MRESRTYGSVRGALRDERPYRVPCFCCDASWSLMARPGRADQRRIRLLIGVKQTCPPSPRNDAIDPKCLSEKNLNRVNHL